MSIHGQYSRGWFINSIYGEVIMALDSDKTTENALTKLRGAGFVVDGEFSRQREFVQAIVEAVIEDIKSDAKVAVTGGSSAGSYKVQ